MARWLALIAIAHQISCSGGKTAISTNFNAAPAVTVMISPGSAQIAAGASVQFLVTVENASNPAVTWQVNGVPGGNSSVGTISASGAATASYAAPASVAGPLAVMVTAVLQADSTKFGSARVTINPLPGATISISPANRSVVEGTSLQFTATVQNGPQAVIWEVNGIQGGTATFGTITSSPPGSLTASYTAPAVIPSPPVVVITAALVTDLSILGKTNVTIVAPVPSVSISPSTANVVSGQTLQFSAGVQNSNAGVVWQVNGIPGGNPTSGFGIISTTGLYTAPVTVPNPATISVTAVLQTSPPISASAGVTIISATTLAGVYSWKNDNSLTGQNSQETTLTPSTVSASTFGKLFGCAVDGQVYAQPLYVSNVTVPNLGTRNVAYVATEHDSVYAFDAENSACQILWKASFTNSALSITAVPAMDIPGQTDITPIIGITGTPVINPNTATLYVVTKTKINQGATPSYQQELHALDLTTGWVGGVAGAEKFGGPTIIQATVNGTGAGSVSGKISFDPLTENQRSALLLAGGNVYVAFDSYSDIDPFHGWIFAYDAADLQAMPAVFNTTPNGSRGGIGESGAAPSSDASANVFVVTSDGTTAAPNTGTDHPDTLLKLQASGLSILDSFLRANEPSLAIQHKYFGSSGVLLLPDLPPGSAHPQLALVGDEAGNVYLLDRDNLAAGALQTLSFNGPIFGTPAFWSGNNTVYLAAAGDNLRALPLSGGMLSSPSCSPSLCSADTFPLFGASPVISWDGTNAASGIVWALDTTGSLAVPAQPAILYAYKATDLTRLYASPASSNDPLAAGPAVKFTVPTVANGKVYVGTQGELSVFGLH